MTETVSAQLPAVSAPSTDPHAAATILNSSTLVMGLTGAGKTALLATLMEWLWETFRATTFYYSYDGGGFPTQVQSLVNRGICRLWRVRTRSGEGLAPETIQRAAMGWWPERIQPLTGVTTPTVRLIAPVTTFYTMSCPNGHLMRTSAAKTALTPGPCPTCRVQVDRTNMQVTQTAQRTKGFPELRAVMHDGISSACSWLLEDLSHRTLGGEQSRLGGTVMSGDMVFGENNRAQVGFTQNSAERWVLASSGVPGLVIPPVWTALTKEGSDEASLTVVGPDLAGQAKIAVAGQWFGNTVEALVAERGGKKYRQLRTAQWIDEKQRRHLCRVGSYPGTIPAIFEEEEQLDGAGAFVEFNLGLFHQRLADARRVTEARYTEKYQDAPGLPSGETVYGEQTEAAQPPPAGPGGAQGSAPAPPRVAPGPPRPPAPKGPPPAKPAGAGPQVVGTGTPAVASQYAPTSPANVVGPRVAAAAQPPVPQVTKVIVPAQAGNPTAAAGTPPPPKPPQPGDPTKTTTTPAPTGTPSERIVGASVVATGPLPPATVGPPKAPQKGPAMPAGRKPQ